MPLNPNMALTDQQKRVVTVIVVGAVIIALLIGAAQVYRRFLGASILGPQAGTESIVGGLLSIPTAGEHTLEFQAQTATGQVISDNINFTATEEVLPYGGPSLPSPTPPAPYGGPSVPPSPY